MDKQDREKALALLGALISPTSTIASLGLQKMMPPREEFENSLFSRMIPGDESPTGKREFIPEETMEGAFWKKGSPLLPRFLKPETKLSPVTQERLVQEMIRAVGATKDEAVKNRKGQTVMEMMNKLPMKEGKGVSGAELQKLAAESGSTSHKKGEVNGLRVLQNALANRSIYHGVKTPDGENRLWQELFKPPGEARDVRAAMVKRRVEKNVATPSERQEYELKNNAARDPMEAMMETLRLMGKLPPK